MDVTRNTDQAGQANPSARKPLNRLLGRAVPLLLGGFLVFGLSQPASAQWGGIGLGVGGNGGIAFGVSSLNGVPYYTNSPVYRTTSYGYSTYNQPQALWTVGMIAPNGQVFQRWQMARTSSQAIAIVQRKFPRAQVAYARLEFRYFR